MPNESQSHYGTRYHVPVLVNEVLEWLNVGRGETYVDGTLGGGGHTAAILDASAPDGRVVAIDRDPEAHQAARERFSESQLRRVEFVVGNYRDTREKLDELGIEAVDGLLVDAGVSSHQFDDPTRGFSFREAGPLDMRMGPDAQTLESYFETVDLQELTRALKEYGEIKKAYYLARALLEAWADGRIETTEDLAQVVVDEVGTRGPGGRRSSIHPATLVFQALRIAVNEELQSLEHLVSRIPDIVKPGGRAVFISFHSLEDRIVKHGFRRHQDGPDLPKDIPLPAERYEGCATVLTRRPIEASPEEIEQNPRARSARLRVLEIA